MIDVTLQVDALSTRPGGIGRYTWELCKGLRDRDDVSVRFHGRRRFLDDPEILLKQARLTDRPGWIARWRTGLQLSRQFVHGPNFFLPRQATQGVITVHDLSVFRYPETHPAARVQAFERMFRASLAKAAHVITDTQTVRQELIDDFAVDPLRITAVHLGVSTAFRTKSGFDGSLTLAHWGLASNSYGLCVSTLEPRKKVRELLAAWRRLPAALRDAVPLVLAGGAGWRNSDLMADIDQGRTEGWLRPLGFVAEADLPALYAGARLFVYPSMYEGFGLPPLEAMASGTPVLVSDRSCMPEVCGDAARYINPDDADGFTAALDRCLSDDDWQIHAAAAGQAHAAQFTWERCVDRTVGVYAAASSS